MSNHGFIKQIRGEKVLEMLLKHPNAFLLFNLIALRARYQPSKSIEGLEPGEALIGYKDLPYLTRQNYRTALGFLQGADFLTIRITNKGTIAKLIDNSVWDINIQLDNHQSNHQSNHRVTTDQPPGNHRVTTNKERKKERKEEGELTIVRSPPPNPINEKKGEDGGGGRKIAFIYEGVISEKAYAANKKSKQAGISIRPDKFQQWIDEYGLDAVRIEFEGTLDEIAKGKKIGNGALYVGKRLSNNHFTLEQTQQGIQNDFRSNAAQR